MEELKREYEEKLQKVTGSAKSTENLKSTVTILENDITSNEQKSEIKLTDRIKSIKDILIGGERANDTQLKEKHFKKKLAAQKKL